MSTNNVYFKIPTGFKIIREIACGNTEQAKQKINEVQHSFSKNPDIKCFRREGWIFICQKQMES
jgi:5-bromo-4-chloroindolyl phosphate hydrolysis protein